MQETIYIIEERRPGTDYWGDYGSSYYLTPEDAQREIDRRQTTDTWHPNAHTDRRIATYQRLLSNEQPWAKRNSLRL